MAAAATKEKPEAMIGAGAPASAGVYVPGEEEARDIEEARGVIRRELAAFAARAGVTPKDVAKETMRTDQAAALFGKPGEARHFLDRRAAWDELHAVSSRAGVTKGERFRAWEVLDRKIRAADKRRCLARAAAKAGVPFCPQPGRVAPRVGQACPAPEAAAAFTGQTAPQAAAPQSGPKGGRMVVTATMKANMGKHLKCIRGIPVVWFKGDRHEERLAAVMALETEMERFMLDTDPPVSSVVNPARVHPLGAWKFEDDCVEVLDAVLGRIVAARRVLVSAWEAPNVAAVPGSTVEEARRRIVEAVQHVDAAATALIMRVYQDWQLYFDWEAYMAKERGWTRAQCGAQHTENRRREARVLRGEAAAVFGGAQDAVEAVAVELLRLADGAPPPTVPGGLTPVALPGSGALEALRTVLDRVVAARRAFAGAWTGRECACHLNICRGLSALRIAGFALIVETCPELRSFRCRWNCWTKKGAW